MREIGVQITADGRVDQGKETTDKPDEPLRSLADVVAEAPESDLKDLTLEEALNLVVMTINAAIAYGIAYGEGSADQDLVNRMSMRTVVLRDKLKQLVSLRFTV